jgi:hypothetical protein
MRLWLLRAIWITLPLSAGGAAAGAISTWNDAPRVVAAALLWLAWAAGTLALLAPRPVGLTVLRVIAPAFAALAVVAAITADVAAIDAVAAIVATLVAAVLVAGADIALTAANAVAYGDERRFPLRTPPALFVGLIPIARVLVTAGVTTGPLLIADDHVIAGVVALLIGTLVVAMGGRSLHLLSRRWLVLVPAGVVVIDPMTLPDPVLFVRSQVRTLRAVSADAPVPDGGIDLRLGASMGTVAITLSEPTDLVRAERAGRRATTVTTSCLLVAVVRRQQFLDEAGERRVRVVPRD